MEIDGNVLAAKSLVRFGVRHMFGVVGIPVTSLANRAVALGVRFIAFHNEQSAGYAASAYGYLTASPGVFLTVSGPGCVHGLAGLSNASVNTWPTVLISGSCNQNDVGRGDFQELNQIEATKPFSKLSVRASHISEIPACVAQVLEWAQSGRPGGCYLDLPTDVLHQKVSESEAEKLLTEVEKNRAKPEPYSISNSKIEEAVSLLRRAERPLIVFGKGAAYARAENALTKLVEATGIPFLPTPMGKGLLPDTHSLAATAARSLAIGKCDVALVVGARLNWLLHFGEPPKWSKDVKFILVDVSEEEIELRKPHLGLVGDAKHVIEVLSRYVKLTKDHGPLEDITPGELNQPIEVPQLAVHKCMECGQPLPESYTPPSDEAWMTGIFGCAEDRENCLTGLFCPCVLFGRNVESLHEETPWTGPCICHAIFIEGGIALATATAIFNGYIDPGTSFLIFEGLFFTWWMCGIYTGQVRQTLQKKYHLENSPCDPCCVHCCMHWCALCQEHREMKGRLFDNGFSEGTIVNAPPIQEMKSSDNKENPETSSHNRHSHEHTGLELQPV